MSAPLCASAEPGEAWVQAVLMAHNERRSAHWTPPLATQLHNYTTLEVWGTETQSILRNIENSSLITPYHTLSHLQCAALGCGRRHTNMDTDELWIVCRLYGEIWQDKERICWSESCCKYQVWSEECYEHARQETSTWSGEQFEQSSISHNLVVERGTGSEGQMGGPGCRHKHAKQPRGVCLTLRAPGCGILLILLILTYLGLT